MPPSNHPILLILLIAFAAPLLAEIPVGGIPDFEAGLRKSGSKHTRHLGVFLRVAQEHLHL